jgi:2',3'-cyclic-nucleotide 2'-phosphodiesterase (5'-nucleotidase family)
MPARRIIIACVAAAACGPPRPLENNASFDLVVAATTDVHGRLRGWDYYANAPDSLHGLSRAATIIDSLRHGASVFPVVVDAGDFLQGNPLA